MIDREWLLFVNEAIEADHLLDIDGDEAFLRWADKNFKMIIAMSDHPAKLRINISSLQDVLVVDDSASLGSVLSSLQLGGRMIAILHKNDRITDYQIIMIFLRQLLLSSKIKAVLIEDANRIRSIVNEMLDTDRFGFVPHDEMMLIKVL